MVFVFLSIVLGVTSAVLGLKEEAVKQEFCADTPAKPIINE